MRLFGIPGVPLALTLAGLVPFAVGAGVMWVPEIGPVHQAQAALALLVYAGVILSFLGAVRWGAEINAQGGGGIPRAPLMVLSVLGSLAGWGLVLWGVLGSLGWPVFAAAAAAHVAQGVWDADGAGLPYWYRRLRVLAAFLAAASLVAAAAVYLIR